MKTILFATDYSQKDQKAMAYVCELSKRTGAQIVALHIHDVPTIMNTSSDAPTFQEIERDVVEMNKKKLLDFCQKNSYEDSVKLNIRFEARENTSTVQGILSMIDEINADLVIIGVKGESKLKELLMGSTSMGVIRQANCPVLTIPGETQFKPFGHIIYATDFEEEDIEAINSLTEIAGLFDANLKVIHISTKHEDAVSEKMEWFKELLKEKVDYSKLNFELLHSNDIQDCLNSYVIENNIALIAMLERESKNIFNKWFHKDLVKQMEFHTSVPLLSFNENCLARISKVRTRQTTKQ
jgi:nucleotide-binding universal stress UspA family protein